MDEYDGTLVTSLRSQYQRHKQQTNADGSVVIADGGQLQSSGNFDEEVEEHKNLRVSEFANQSQTEKVVKKKYPAKLMINNPYDEVNIIRRQQRMFVRDEEYVV